MKYIYFGSSIFSRIILENLCEQAIIPAMVISQPDKPKGRGLALKPMEVSAYALKKQIPLIRPASLNHEETLKKIQSGRPEFIVVADYGKLLPKRVLSAAKIMPLGVHPSLLPRYRGAAPLNWALLHGETQTGTTIFKMDEKMDSGEIILQEAMAIEAGDDVASLGRKLALQGAKLLVRAFTMILQEDYALVPQDEKSASFAPKLTKNDGRINWNVEATKIIDLIRAVTDWPSAYTFYSGKLLKILKAGAIKEQLTYPAGTVAGIKKDGIYVAVKFGMLHIKSVKPEGKREMDAYSFALGHRVKVGDKFGEVESRG